ncbi:MAG: SH3 domain-containing protein [Lachnospiraceae bacterium]|nr:SH3 domain-containing protein [Lachnospiraceae bacterium]
MRKKILYAAAALAAITGVTTGILVFDTQKKQTVDTQDVAITLPNDMVMEYANRIQLDSPVITAAKNEDTLAMSMGMNKVAAEIEEDNTAEETELNAEIGGEMDAEYAVMYGNAGSDVQYPEWKDAVVAKVEGSVRVREKAGTDSEIVGKMYDTAVGTVVENGEEWTKITSGNVTGYVSNDYLIFGDEAGEYIEENYMYAATVQVPTLNVRAEAAKTSECIGSVKAGKALEVVDDTDDEWVEIQYTEDTTAYVAKEYVELAWNYPVALTIEEEQELIQAEAARKAAEAAAATQTNNTSAAVSAAAPPAPVNTSAEGLALGQEIANYACQFVGNPYVYGGSSLTNGTDCSGFTMAVYAQFGYSLPHASSAQKGCGTSVPLDQVQPGDIICYSGHVGMYIGGGQIVHAGTESTGIYITSMYYDSPYDARRIVQ